MAETVTRIKICGITSQHDALTAAAAGADALGFVFAPSPRRVTPEAARAIIDVLPPFIVRVGVFLNMDRNDILSIAEQTGINAIQLHGDESPARCRDYPRPIIKRIKVDPDDTSQSLAIKVKDYRVAAILLDPGAGSGQVFDWTIARSLSANLIIAGGLTPDNVGAAIELLRPYGVDVCSGTEKHNGVKDAAKVQRFISEVRKCFMD